MEMTGGIDSTDVHQSCSERGHLPCFSEQTVIVCLQSSELFQTSALTRRLEMTGRQVDSLTARLDLTETCANQQGARPD